MMECSTVLFHSCGTPSLMTWGHCKLWCLLKRILKLYHFKMILVFIAVCLCERMVLIVVFGFNLNVSNIVCSLSSTLGFCPKSIIISTYLIYVNIYNTYHWQLVENYIFLKKPQTCKYSAGLCSLFTIGVRQGEEFIHVVGLKEASLFGVFQNPIGEKLFEDLPE